MNIAIGLAFLFLEILLLIAAMLLLLRLGFARLESAVGVLGDGLVLGSRAPSWALPDLEDQAHSSPSGSSWQILFFTDHSLEAFPELIAGIDAFLQKVPQLEVLILARGDKAFCLTNMHALPLHIPIIPVTCGSSSAGYFCKRR